MREKIKKLNQEELRQILLKMVELLSEEQQKTLNTMICEYMTAESKTEQKPAESRMSQAFVDEKMSQIQLWMKQIEEGDLYLDINGYFEKMTDRNSSTYLSPYLTIMEEYNKIHGYEKMKQIVQHALRYVTTFE